MPNAFTHTPFGAAVIAAPWINVFAPNKSRGEPRAFCVTQKEELVMFYEADCLAVYDKEKGLVELIELAPKPTERHVPRGVRLRTVRTRPLDIDRGSLFCMGDGSLVMMSSRELAWFKRDGTLVASVAQEGLIRVRKPELEK